MKVLVSVACNEDEALIQDALAGVAGADVRVVESMDQARPLLKTWQPDVAFVDPAAVLDGPFAGTRAADQLARSQGIPVTVESLSKTGYLCLLKSVNPRVNLVFVATGAEFAMVGMELRVSGYLSRPLTKAAVEEELASLRFAVSETGAAAAGAGAPVAGVAGAGAGAGAVGTGTAAAGHANASGRAFDPGERGAAGLGPDAASVAKVASELAAITGTSLSPAELMRSDWGDRAFGEGEVAASSGGMVGIHAGADGAHASVSLSPAEWGSGAGEAARARAHAGADRAVEPSGLAGAAYNVANVPAFATDDYVAPLQTGDGLFVRTFGNFEVFHNGTPVRFKHGLTRELFAYLVDRAGAMVTNSEISAVLWSDGRPKSHASYLRMMKADLVRTLDALGYGAAVEKAHGKIACVPSEINCDYFYFLANAHKGTNRLKGIARYRGEYMSQYSWAEPTSASLAQM